MSWGNLLGTLFLLFPLLVSALVEDFGAHFQDFPHQITKWLFGEENIPFPENTIFGGDSWIGSPQTKSAKLFNGNG